MPTFPQDHYSNHAGQNGSTYAHKHTGAPHHDQSLIAIGPLLNILWQRKGLIALITAIFVGLAFLYVMITPKTFTANGVIVIDPLQVRVLDSEAALSGIGANSAAIASQVEIIQSRTLVNQVFMDEGYIDDPEFSKPRMLSVLFNLFSTPKPITQTKIFNNFWKRLDVERQGLTYVINVSFKSESAQKSAQIVNALIAAYMGSQVIEKSGANAEVAVLLNAQMEGLRAELSQKEAAVEAFKVTHGILSVSTGRTLLESQIEQLSAQLVVARELARAASNRHLQVASVNARSDSLTSLFEILTDNSPNSLRANYTQSSMAHSSLQASLGPRHPNLLVAAAELGRLENLIRNEAQTVLTQIASEKDLAQTNVENAQVELIALRAQNSLSNQNQVELRDLERQAGATRQVLEQLIGREQETGQLENLQRSDARVISEAVAPILATWPKSTLLLAIAAFFGLALGSAISLYLGPKNAVNSARREETHPADAYQYPQQSEYAYVGAQQVPATNYAPDYGLQRAPTHPHTYGQTAPIYHSSELTGQTVANGYANETVPAPNQDAPAYGELATRYAPNHQTHHQSASPSKLWSRRANGEPYSAPNETTQTNYSQNFQRPQSSAQQNNMPNSDSRSQPKPGITREGFVSELKRRMEQHDAR